ncbi:MAG: sigma-70 family RNA polymerase sigma factor [Scytonematopsis contorta HA4267-MV1]|jgi:DNA-directed RNA polymerase specialized sigma24 family protein|nr:sigma-70 family RNA polymerase sigma factor [Scytonematopsis contorta HA4267-MV1]
MNQKEFSQLDSQLKQLALAAQKNPPQATARQLALNQLVNKIVSSRRLCRPQQGLFTGVYQEIYAEAVQELMLYICQNIDKYDAERGTVMAWVNVLLERRFFKEAIPRIIGKPGIVKMTLSDLENFVVPESNPDLTEVLREYIELDPENIFRKTYIDNNPQANFQVIGLQRILGKSWKDIAGEFGLNIKTVSSFYYRCLNKFSDKFKDYCY